METKLVNDFVDLFMTKRDDEACVKSLGLIGRLNSLSREFKEAVAFAISERLAPNDPEILSALATHRNRGTSLETVVARLEKTANAFGTNNNPFKERPEIFDLTGAILLCLSGEQAGATPSTLAELAMLHIQALKTPTTKLILANWMYTGRGHLSAQASRLLSPPAPAWLRATLDAAIGDAKPQTITSRQVIGSIHDRLVKTWEEVRQGRPVAIIGIGAITFSMLLFGVAMAASAKRSTPVLAVAQAPTPSPTQQPATVFENFGKALKEKGSILENSKLMISPRVRDDGDILLAKAITSADIKGVTVVPTSITREVLGNDAPRYSAGWVTTATLIPIDPSIAAATTSADKNNKVYYVDFEFDGPDQGRVSVINVQDKTPSVLLIVSGAAPGLQPAVRSQWFVDRALRLSGDPQSSTVALLLAQAKAAATTDFELAQVNLNLALVHVAGGRKIEAQKAAEEALPWLSEADKERLPEPLRRAVEMALRPLKTRVLEQVGLK